MSVIRRLPGLAVVIGSIAMWALVLLTLVEPRGTALVLLGFLMLGPTWAYAFCLASTDDDFPDDAWRGREGWVRLLPVTFLLAPLVVPTMALLIQFFRDARADHGQTWLGYGRSRPGDR